MNLLKKVIGFYEKNNTLKNYLVVANVSLVLVLIVLASFKILPFQNIGDFIFFVGISLVLALYRPGWSFLFFVGVIMLENINLAPNEIGLSLRPYQLIGIITIIAVGIRYFSGRLGFKLPKISRTDALVIIFALAGFVSSFFALDKSVSFKQSIIIASFVGLYFLTRIFIQDLKDLKRIISFFLSSSSIVILYGIWQNWRFAKGQNSFEVMLGRPNSTFAEPDWLGMFLVLLISILYAIIFKISDKKETENDNFQLAISGWKEKILHYKHCWIDLRFLLLLIGSYSLLILTVSRSAWLGAGAVSILYLVFCIWYALRNGRRKIFRIPIFMGMSFAVALLIILTFNLTNFELGKRLQSTGGKQEITVACGETELQNNQIIQNISELEKYNCHHINLEDIEKEKTGGKSILKVYRDDPNVNIRAEIYKKSWEQIKNHPIIGIGWGNIGKILGTDENGNSLNSSNIFVEVWLGAGIIGLLSFVVILSFVFIKVFRQIIYSFNNQKYFKIESYDLFVLLSFFAIIIPNLFNAGIMLGFLWVWLAIMQVDSPTDSVK